MKNSGKIAGMLLMLFIAGNLSLNAQRGMRGMRSDTARMNNMGRSAMGPAARQFQGRGMQQAAPGMRIMENIPNLTDKQKKDIAELRQKQQDEMQKLREGMQVKVNDLRESHRTKVMNLLTDEQKKWVDENTPKPLNK